ncbi:MAG: hypothetical protein RL110_792 [Bacteroidota bacterium]|jgi:hypothetical protein
MRKAILFVFGACLCSMAFGQNYKTAIGIKGGYPGYGSISAKHFLGDVNAVELNVGTGLYGLTLQGLYEWNHQLPTNGLSWYLGVGPNLGLQSSQLNNGSTLFLSGSGLIGIEYTFNGLPINLALDSGPILQVIPNIGLGWGGGVAVRYTLK